MTITKANGKILETCERREIKSTRRQKEGSAFEPHSEYRLQSYNYLSEMQIFIFKGRARVGKSGVRAVIIPVRESFFAGVSGPGFLCVNFYQKLVLSVKT